MTDEELKKLKQIIKDEIRPVKDIVEMTKKKVDSQQIFLHSTAENVREIKEQQSIMNGKMDDMQDTLDSNTASVMEIEKTLKSYADSYKINQHNIERVDTRLANVEKKLDIRPPEDLKVHHFAE